MFFILYQNWALGLIALGVVAIQAVVIPKLRKRLLVLGRERQLTARELAGRIAEIVDGAAEIHANDTSNYERADISARLGRIFKIRFDLYQWKFLVKFLNNFLSQVTPFLFYSVGGYLAIMGRLDIGQLVAVIAAYKDLPGPMKELIDWDQQRLDVQIKYQQVVEQFSPRASGAGRAAGDRRRPPPLARAAEGVEPVARRRTRHAKVVEGVSFEVGLDEHVAIGGGSGASDLGADARAPGAAYQRLDQASRRRHHSRAGGADRTRASATSVAAFSSRHACATMCSTA